MEIQFVHSPLWLIPAAALAAVLVYLQYGKNAAFKPRQARILAALRFLLYLSLAFFLLQPQWQSKSVDLQKPTLIWLTDVSTSLPDSLPIEVQSLKEKYDLHVLPFADGLWQGDSAQLSHTDISKAMRSAEERFGGSRTSAMVLVSDGIYNRGSNPLNGAEKSPFPIFTLGRGDSTQVADLRISSVQLNPTVFRGNFFTVEVGLSAEGLAGEESMLKLVDQNGQVRAQERIRINSNRFSKSQSFVLKADELGTQLLRLELEVLEEQNAANNSTSVSYEVVEDVIQIGLWSSGPHPDQAAIKAALRSARYNIDGGFGPLEEGKSDLLILHNPTEAQLLQAIASDLPLWLLQGPSTSLSALKQLGVEVGNNFEPVRAVENTAFTTFNRTAILDPISDVAVLAPFGNYRFQGPTNPILFKKLGNLITDQALWYYCEREGRRLSITHAQNIWGWRMENFRQDENFENFDELVQATVAYLSVGERKSRFVLDTERSYPAFSQIALEALVYDANNQLSNQAEVRLKLSQDEGPSYSFDFQSAGERYLLSLNKLEEGLYRYSAVATLGSEKFERSGSFTVLEDKVEQSDTRARFELLRALSKRSGGAYYSTSEADGLIADLLESPAAKPIAVERQQNKALIALPLFFFWLFTLAGIEWIARKYFGKY